MNDLEEKVGKMEKWYASLEQYAPQLQALGKLEERVKDLEIQMLYKEEIK